MIKGFVSVFIITALIISISSVKSAFAISAPVPISPEDSSTISTNPKLTWETTPESIQYKVIVDNESEITSPYIKGPYYTTNTNYSPQLVDGTYFWKVAAKDASGTWSDWSTISSFTLSPEQSDNSEPVSSPTATTTPAPSSIPTQTPKSTFTFNNVPSQIDADQSFVAQIDLSLPNNPNSVFYLKGAFKASDSSNYFGFTKVGGSWIKNGSSYSAQYKITTDSSGYWTGTLEIKPDQEDSGFTGSGNYIFKIARYGSSGSGPTWSNEQTISITAVSELTTSSDPKTNPISSPAVKGITKSISVNTKEGSLSSRSALQNYASPSAQIKSDNDNSEISESLGLSKFLPVIGGILIITGSLVLFYIQYRKKSTILTHE